MVWSFSYQEFKNSLKFKIMFCSTIIPTIGRETLARAVDSILEQDFMEDDFEVIVVNDTGRPLPYASWQELSRVQIVTTNQRERCVARNTGAAKAKGKYLHFLDDDDWMYPKALQIFWEISQDKSEAAWFYGGVELIDSTGELIAPLNMGRSGNCFVQAVAGAWFPLQASLINAKVFFEIGGFNPVLYATQDLDLARRIALIGEFINIQANVAGVQRSLAHWDSSTDYVNAPHYNRWSRNQILNDHGVFNRMRVSADTAYWHGRILHAYLTSFHLNMRHLRLTTAFSRIIFAVFCLLTSGLVMFRREYWQAVFDDRVPFTSAYIIQSTLDDRESS